MHYSWKHPCMRMPTRCRHRTTQWGKRGLEEDEEGVLAERLRHRFRKRKPGSGAAGRRDKARRQDVGPGTRPPGGTCPGHAPRPGGRPAPGIPPGPRGPGLHARRLAAPPLGRPGPRTGACARPRAAAGWATTALSCARRENPPSSLPWPRPTSLRCASELGGDAGRHGRQLSSLPTARCPDQVLFIETGFGSDQHGQNATKAATRACRNAIEFNSIPSIKRIVPGGYNGLRLHVKVGTPHPVSAFPVL